MEKEVFKRSIPNHKKCEVYGFKDGIYEKVFMNTFKAIISIQKDEVKGKVIDLDFEEEYTNIRIENSTSAFVNQVKEEYEKILIDIRDHCFDAKYFISHQANRISSFIQSKYSISPEFLFDSNPNVGVFRNQKKWFGIIMNVSGQTLHREEKEVEIMNVKCTQSKVKELLKKDGFYEAYHMNKKYWISICLNDEVEDSIIEQLIEDSYQNTIQKEIHEWVIPANPKYYDLITEFKKGNTIWKVIKNIHTGDTVYFYVAKPYSCILYKCKVIDENEKNRMILELVEEYDPNTYTLDIISNYGIKTVRGPRSMPQSLLDYMEVQNVKESM